MKLLSTLAVLAILTLVSFKIKDNTLQVKDYFAIPGPITYNKTPFNLSWSDHPNDTYYRQGYIPANEKEQTYTKMISVEAVIGAVNIKDIVKAKTNELDQRKQIDPLTNYQVIVNKATGEYLLDFVVSQSIGDKKAVVEWNAYRYVTLKNIPGKKGILLFSYSKRGYGNGTTNFLKSLKTERSTEINNFAAYKVPDVKLDR
ncbi:MAG: hypothetical protein ABIN89_28895 [Chitinophagaceae bacterium]